jgi:hypothetical protein
LSYGLPSVDPHLAEEDKTSDGNNCANAYKKIVQENALWRNILPNCVYLLLSLTRNLGVVVKYACSANAYVINAKLKNTSKTTSR